MDHSEEWQAQYHEAYWRTFRGKPWIWCKAVWTMFDFASAGRNEGEKPGINDKGLVTRDRRIRKDAYYWYQAQWSRKPMAHVTGSRFTPRNAQGTEVKVYSNCTRVVLKINGLSHGSKKVQDGIAAWSAVHLRTGANRIEAVGTQGGERVVDRCVWTVETTGNGAGQAPEKKDGSL